MREREILKRRENKKCVRERERTTGRERERVKR